jgi:hypothetical protein
MSEEKKDDFKKTEKEVEKVTSVESSPIVTPELENGKRGVTNLSSKEEEMEKVRIDVIRAHIRRQLVEEEERRIKALKEYELNVNKKTGKVIRSGIISDDCEQDAEEEDEESDGGEKLSKTEVKKKMKKPVKRVRIKATSKYSDSDQDDEAAVSDTEDEEDEEEEERPLPRKRVQRHRTDEFPSKRRVKNDDRKKYTLPRTPVNQSKLFFV